jgi:hypothetical protein
MLPLLRNPVHIEAFSFYIDGGVYSEEFLNSGNRWWASMNVSPKLNALSSVSEIINNYDLYQFSKIDAGRLSYGFPLHGSFVPSSSLTFRNHPAFSGKIWLLTDSMMYSAAQIVAWAVKDSGFATLVGETTGGVYGGSRTIAALPNSGILFQFDVFYITDRYGRPLEAGTEPDFFNHEGKDALETTLVLIEEWDN